jgi:UDP-glucose 4-epimerase
VFNVSTGEGRSIRDVYEAVARYLQIEPPPAADVEPGPDDVPEVVLDPSETEAKLGWKARRGFQETIDRQLAWYDKHGISAIFSHLAAPKN